MPELESGDRPRLQVLSPVASADEVAAIVAAMTVVLAPAPGAAALDVGSRSSWVAASRLAARRTGLSRGEWRLSGRIGRRARA